MQRVILIALLGIGFFLFTLPAGAQADFVRGDCNADTGIDIGDPVYLLNLLFSGGTPASCDDACDANDDGTLNIADAVYKLAFLFAGGPPPPDPYPACGPDTTDDPLTCDSFAACSTATEICDDMIDNDGDGFIDCLDIDCDNDPACMPLSHDIDIQPIWGDASGSTGFCTLCHAGPNPFADLDLSPGVAYMAMVNVPSAQCANLDMVEPGNSAASWTYRKVVGDQEMAATAAGCDPGEAGTTMPIAGCCLPQGDLDLIQAWIDGGANP